MFCMNFFYQWLLGRRNTGVRQVWWFLFCACFGAGAWSFLHHDAPPTPRVLASKQTPASQTVLPGAAPPRARQPELPGKRKASLLWGTVVGPDNAVIRGAKICQWADGSHREARCTRTHSDGKFRTSRLNNLTSITASAAGFLSLKLQHLGDIEKAPLSLTLQEGGQRVTGIVRDALGGVVVGALIQATDQTAVALSNSAGEFHLQLPRNWHQLTAGAAGYSDDIRRVWAPSQGATFVLTPAASVSGRVFGMELPAGKGVALAVNMDGLRTRPRTVPVDSQGEFSFEFLPVGEYQVSASGERWRSATTVVSLPAGQSDELLLLQGLKTLELAVGLSVQGNACETGNVHASGPVEQTAAIRSGIARFPNLLPGEYFLELRCQAAVPKSVRVELDAAMTQREWELDPGRSVQGQVLRANGDPWARAQVVIESRGLSQPDANTRCVSDEKGQFRCVGLPTGQYEVRVKTFAGNGTSQRLDLSKGALEGVVLRASPSGRLEVHLAGSSLDVSFEPVVAMRDDGLEVFGNVSADSAIFAALPLGHYEVSRGASSSTVRVDVSYEGQEQSVRLAQTPLASIVGTLEDDQGIPIPDAWLEAIPSENRLVGFRRGYPPALTDSSGEFELLDLPEGSYNLKASAVVGRVEHAGVMTNSDPVVLVMPRHASVSLTASDRSGKRVQGFTLSIQTIGQTREVEQNVAGSTVHLSSLSPASYRFSAFSSEGQASTTRDVGPNDSLRVALVLAPTQCPGAELGQTEACRDTSAGDAAW